MINKIIKYNKGLNLNYRKNIILYKILMNISSEYQIRLNIPIDNYK